MEQKEALEKFAQKHTLETAMLTYVQGADASERFQLLGSFWGSEAQNRPELWDRKIREGEGFSVVPEDTEAIRRALGIKEGDRVIVAPVFSGEWSKIKEDSIGIDFSGEALRRHNNPLRIRADMRDLPFPDAYADNIVSFEPTPLNPNTATLLDPLLTLYELGRVGKNVHIIQRTRNDVPIWTYPFVQQYLAGLGVPYKIHDLTDHTIITGITRPKRKMGVVAVSFRGEDLLKHRATIKKDALAVYKFLRAIAAKKEVTPRDVAQLMRSASPALRKALVEHFVLQKRPRLVRRK